MSKAKAIAVEMVKAAKIHEGNEVARSAAAKAANDTFYALVEHGVVSEEFFGEVVGELATMALMKMLGVEPNLS